MAADIEACRQNCAQGSDEWLVSLACIRTGATDMSSLCIILRGACGWPRSFLPGSPQGCFCPITQEVMRDPVLAADGHTFEREVIGALVVCMWSGKDTSGCLLRPPGSLKPDQ